MASEVPFYDGENMFDRVIVWRVARVKNDWYAELISPVSYNLAPVDRQLVYKKGYVVGPALPPQVIEEREELWYVDRLRMHPDHFHSPGRRYCGKNCHRFLRNLFHVHLQGLINRRPSTIR